MDLKPERRRDRLASRPKLCSPAAALTTTGPSRPSGYRSHTSTDGSTWARSGLSVPLLRRVRDRAVECSKAQRLTRPYPPAGWSGMWRLSLARHSNGRPPGLLGYDVLANRANGRIIGDHPAAESGKFSPAGIS